MLRETGDGACPRRCICWVARRWMADVVVDADMRRRRVIPTPRQAQDMQHPGPPALCRTQISHQPLSMVEASYWPQFDLSDSSATPEPNRICPAQAGTAAKQNRRNKQSRQRTHAGQGERARARPDLSRDGSPGCRSRSVSTRSPTASWTSPFARPASPNSSGTPWRDWIADIGAWCYGAGREWRKRIDPIVNTVIDLE